MVANYLIDIWLFLFSLFLTSIFQMLHSLLHFSMLLIHTICIFFATLNLLIYFFNQLCRIMLGTFLYSINAILSPVCLPLQFLKNILSISNWSFIPTAFLWHPLPIQHPVLFLWQQSLTCQMVIQFDTEYSSEYLSHKSKHVVDLKLVTTFLISLFFISSTALPVVNQSVV